jgi:hypothetical protein
VKGADGIKLFTGSVPGGGKVAALPLAIAKAAVEEAHRHGISGLRASAEPRRCRDRGQTMLRIQRASNGKLVRSLATVAALIAMNRPDQLRFHLHYAMENEETKRNLSNSSRIWSFILARQMR